MLELKSQSLKCVKPLFKNKLDSTKSTDEVNSTTLPFIKLNELLEKFLLFVKFLKILPFLNMYFMFNLSKEFNKSFFLPNIRFIKKVGLKNSFDLDVTNLENHKRLCAW